MLEKHRIHKLKNNLPFNINLGDKFIVGVKIGFANKKMMSILRSIGFPKELKGGETILPPNKFGPISQFNADGREKIHKDQPMETAYRQAEWRWIEWHGPERVEQSKIVDIPYKRYPRTFIPPIGIELKIIINKNKDIIVASPIYEYGKTDEQKAIHTINLFLEIFRECSFFTKEVNEIINTPIKRLNWTILPKGRYPWESIKDKIEKLISNAKKGNQPVIRYRLKKIHNYNPNFIAIGGGGFYGYIIFGFDDKRIYVLESIYYGNATYVFNEQWNKLSKLTKAEILNNELQDDRIIHRESWDNRINSLLN